jgi:hypothetical protein
MAKNSVHKLVDSQSMPITIARTFSVANAAGGSNGAAVTTAVSFTDRFGAGLLTANYVVSVMPSQAAWATITNKTTSGFNVVLTPPATVTLAAGTFDCVVLA